MPVTAAASPRLRRDRAAPRSGAARRAAPGSRRSDMTPTALPTAPWHNRSGRGRAERGDRAEEVAWVRFPDRQDVAADDGREEPVEGEAAQHGKRRPLRLVRADRETAPVATERGQRLDNARIGARAHRRRRLVRREEARQAIGEHGVGQAAGGESPRHQRRRAVADHPAYRRPRQRRAADLAQCLVERRFEIRDAVYQRAVEVEDERVTLHFS